MKKIKLSLILVFAAFVFLSTLLAIGFGAASVSAAPTELTCHTPASTDDKGPYAPQPIAQCDDPAIKGGNCSKITECDLIKNYINPFIALLSALAGIAIVIGIIVGGIQYASSGGDPQKAAAGKQHIKVAVIALLGYLFLYALLRFLVPFGVTG